MDLLTPNAPSLILLSGGLDSAANLALVAQGTVEQNLHLALTIDYGQRAAQSESLSAKRLCSHFGIEHLELEAKWLGALGQSALTDASLHMPNLASTDLDDQAQARKSANQVWVPNRNGLFIAMAASIAEARSLSRILVGFNREEAATFPDNSLGFLEATNRALGFSTRGKIEVASYTVAMDKKQIVETLRTRVSDFPFDLLWSCYEAGTVACGRCESCLRYRRAIS